VMKISALVYGTVCMAVVVNASNNHRLSPALVVRINENHNATWTAELTTRFGSLKEVAMLCGGIANSPNLNLKELRLDDINIITPANMPTDFDSREQWPQCTATVAHVRDQTDCGGCWAFAATESFNDRRCIATNNSKLLSVQDTGACCSGSTCQYSNGCVGGQIGAAWAWFTTVGVVTGGDYDDVNKTDTCTPFSLAPCVHNQSKVRQGHPLCPKGEYKMPPCSSTCGNIGYATSYSQDKVKAKSAFTIKRYPPSLVQTEMMSKGPVATIITVFEDFIHYKSGVYKHLEGSEVGSHAVEVLGWGIEAGEKYWLVKNSWGASWGLGGFVKIGYGEIGIENSWTAGYV